ncbi:unnamed protein product [Symbiodinium sp. CCMP2592]|nr:unnamed protein product [Symbiodinium sp. CCMP2592]
MIQVSRFLVITWLVGPLGWLAGGPCVQAYKLAETPINITNSNDSTVVREVERLLGKNLVHDAGEMNSMPEPHEENATNGTGMQSLAKNLEFLLLKVGQLETVVQLQQAELDAAHTEIDALKEHVGLDVQHVAMAKKRSRDPHAAGDVLKSVLHKHHRQRETRNHDPDAHKDLVTDDPEVAPAQTESPAEALLQREAQRKRSEKEEVSHHSLDASLSSKIPFVDDIADAVETVSGSGLVPADLKTAFDRVAEVDQVRFVQNTVIDTVAKATVILQGFTNGFDFRENCDLPRPSFSYRSSSPPSFVMNFGRQRCTVTLVGQTIELFDNNIGELSVPLPNPLDHLPEQIRKVAGASEEMIDRLISMSWNLLNTAHCNRGDTFHCMAKRVATYVMQFEPPLNWLPEPIKRVAAHTQEAVDRLFQMIHVLLNTAHCNRADSFHCMAKLVANHVQDFAPPMNWLPEQLHTVVNAGQEGVARLFAMVRDLLNTPHCDRGNIFHCMAKKVANYVQEFAPPLNWLPQQLHTVVNAGEEGVARLFAMIRDLLNTAHCDRNNVFHCMAKKVANYVMEFAPPMNFLPQQLHAVVNAGQEGVDRVFAMIRDLLNTDHCDRGNIFHCMAKRVAGYVMQFEPPLNYMPSPVGLLAGSDVNSIQSLVTMGNDLQNCQDFESGHDVMKCLGFKIMERVPPLNYLNKLGDTIGVYLETFAKAGTSLAMKALQGGTSLIQKASLSEFPAVGKMPVRHEQGNLVVQMHSQKRTPHPSLLQLMSEQGRQAGRQGREEDVIMPKFAPGDDAKVTNLITQFHGREANSGSCLAFAPRNKNGAQVGNHQEATKEDWTSAKKEDFVALEPWAVPCDNTWMKENWNKWQGYSFYTGEVGIEKCLQVDFSMTLQPVLAAIVGLSIEILPKDFLSVGTTVCWPTQMPGGLDLSVLRSTIKAGGHLLFSRTLRLAKRFGENTDFVKKNLGTGYQTWRSPLGIAKGESNTAFAPMSLLESNKGNKSQGESEGESEEKLKAGSWYFNADPEEVYLASIDYGDSMGEPNRTWEMRGRDALLRLQAMQEAKTKKEKESKSQEEEGQEEVIELFNFKIQTGMNNYHIQGLLDGNILELGVQMGWGPFQSPAKRIPVADFGLQFAAVLAAIPWISVETKKTAIKAMTDWAWPEEQELEKRQPADPSSMVAWFKSEDASAEWKSSVGSWQARVTRGSPTRKVETGHGAEFPVVHLAGDAHTGIDFGVIMKPDFTICSVTRYLGGTNKRILQHNNPNWLHGHWEGAVGVAFYNHNWVYQHGWGKPPTDWLVMCGNSAGAIFRGQEMRNIGEGHVEKANGDSHLYINDGHFTESSDFGVMEVIVWNRALSDGEMLTSMEYLNSKLGPLRPQPAGMSSMVAWFKSEDADSTWKSSVGGWQGRVTKGSVTKKVEGGHGATVPVTYLTGDSTAGYDFGRIMKKDYTICSVTRYVGTGRKGRILQTNSPNFLHGHYAGWVGVAYYNTWVTQHDGTSFSPLTDWLVMCGNSAGLLYRNRERKNVGIAPAAKIDGDFHVFINEGFVEHDSSEFGVMEVIAWDRELSEEEMWSNMEYLNSKLGPALQPADKASMVAWFQSGDASLSWKSSVGGWQGRVTKGSVTRQVEAGFGATFPVAYLTGDALAGYDFGRIMKKDYTICSVTRYVGDGAKGRILQNNHPNWYHGHYAGGKGVAYYGTWVSHDYQHTGLTDWQVMCGNSAGVLFRGKDRVNIGQNPAAKFDGDFHLFINEGFVEEASRFGVMEIIVWGRELSEEEMWTSMEYLNAKLSGPQ